MRSPLRGSNNSINHLTQGSQSLALGLTMSAPMNRGWLSDYANDENQWRQVRRSPLRGSNNSINHLTQGSQSLALGLTMSAPMNRGWLSNLPE
jgi:hypothetical protein